MDALLEDQTLQAVLSRTDFSGIDNAALDFSQLEDYINDDDDNNTTIYFQEALVGSDLRLPESPRSAIKNINNPINAVNDNHLQHHTVPPQTNLSTSIVSSGTSTPTPAPRTTSVTLVATTKSPKSQLSSHQQVSATIQTPLPNQTVSHIQPSVTVTHITFNGQQNPHQPNRHHLPDSPPDSGSEPPFSPPNDTDKGLTAVNGALHHQPSGQTTNEIMLHNHNPTSLEGMKHFINYNTPSQGHNGHQVMKSHLPPEAGITISPPHQHSPQQLSQLTSLHTHGTLLTDATINQMGPIPGPLGIQVTPVTPQGILSPAAGHLTTLYSNEEYLASCECISSPEQTHQVQHQNKKRKISGTTTKNTTNSNIMNGGIVHIKQEPINGGLSPEPTSGSSLGNIHTTTALIPSGDDEYFDYGPDGQVYLDSVYQCIRFQAFQQNTWCILCDNTFKELPPPNYRVDADKGFNFSNADEAFVCQKKNHFQVTVHIQPIGEPVYITTLTDGIKKIDQFYIHFYGCKVESPSQTIKVEQSQSDRSKKAFHPVMVELSPDQVSKTTVGRLHFSETTSNNMRKKGKPNPDQRYFHLVVCLCAHVGDQSYPIIAHASERIIVRASNPGQFENDMELSWQKGHSPESIYHSGRVGVNTDRPDESLVVYGNVKVTGHIIQPSDCRAKTHIEELDTKEQLKNVTNMRIVRYQFKPEFAKGVGLSDRELDGTGVLAQEVQQILPDAVKDTGDVILPDGETIENFLVVNKDRIFMENVGAVKELCKVTDNLETRIDELERINYKLNKFNRFDSIKSVVSTSSVASGSTVTCNSSSYTARATCKRKHSHHRRCSSSTPTLCTNRFVQSVIMILVLIMAFCLASIATLYILEYHWRHTNHIPPMVSNHNTGHSYYTNNYNNVNMNSNVRHSQSYPTQSTHDPQSIIEPINDKSTNKDKTVHNTQFNTQHTSTASPSRTVKSVPIILKPQVLGAPYSCIEFNTVIPSCPVHCCSGSGSIAPPIAASSSTQSDIATLSISKTSESSPPLSSSSSPSPSPSSPSVSFVSSSNNNVFKTELKTSTLSNDDDPYSRTRYIPDTANGDSNHPNTLINSAGDDETAPLSHQINSTILRDLYHKVVNHVHNTTSTQIVAEHFDTKKRLDEGFASKYGNVDIQSPNEFGDKSNDAREKRETSEASSKVSVFKMPRKDLSKSVESLKLMELNATIGRQYCSTLQCVQGTGPRFNYLIPLSKLMELEYVTAQFSLTQEMIVDHCDFKDTPVSCPSPHQGAENIPQSYHRSPDHLLVAENSPNWRIPIGLYLRSTFVFRILARDIDVDSPCSLPDSQIGVSFIEYKLEFHRKCDK